MALTLSERLTAVLLVASAALLFTLVVRPVALSGRMGAPPRVSYNVSELLRRWHAELAEQAEQHRREQEAVLPSASPQRDRVLVISYYMFGASTDVLPAYVSLWFDSCEQQAAFADCVLWLVQQDDDRRSALSELVSCAWPGYERIVRRMRLSELVGALARLGVNQPLADPGKMIDIKPLYGQLNEALLLDRRRPYTHWAWCDVDGVLGRRLNQYVNNSVAPFQTFYFRGGWTEPTMAGQISLFYNSNETREAWRTAPNAIADIEASDRRSFDELGFPKVLTGRLTAHREAAAADHLSFSGDDHRLPYRVRNGTITDGWGSDFVFFHFGRAKRFGYFRGDHMCRNLTRNAFEIVLDYERSHLVDLAP